MVLKGDLLRSTGRKQNIDTMLKPLMLAFHISFVLSEELRLKFYLFPSLPSKAFVCNGMVIFTETEKFFLAGKELNMNIILKYAGKYFYLFSVNRIT